MIMGGSGMRSALLGVAMLALAACAATFRNHGYVPTEAELAQLDVGQDTRESVVNAIGQPTSEGLMQGDSWYYVQSRWRHETYKAPEEIEREVVALSFTSDDRLANIERFGLEDGQIVALSRRVTDDPIRARGPLRRLFGNLGFNPAQFVNRPQN